MFSTTRAEESRSLLEAGLSRITIEPVLEVIARHPTTQPHVQPPVGEDVEHRALLRKTHGVMERQGIDQVAKAQPLGSVGEIGDDQVGRRQHAVVGVVMLGKPSRQNPAALLAESAPAVPQSLTFRHPRACLIVTEGPKPHATFLLSVPAAPTRQRKGRRFFSVNILNAIGSCNRRGCSSILR